MRFLIRAERCVDRIAQSDVFRDPVKRVFAPRLSQTRTHKGEGRRHPSQAQPLPLWHCLSRDMQLSPQAFPFRRTLQQETLLAWANAAPDSHGLISVGPANPSVSAIAMAIDFMVLSPPLQIECLITSLPSRLRGRSGDHRPLTTVSRYVTDRPRATFSEPFHQASSRPAARSV